MSLILEVRYDARYLATFEHSSNLETKERIAKKNSGKPSKTLPNKHSPSLKKKRGKVPANESSGKLL
jgi:hypothetical protein